MPGVDPLSSLRPFALIVTLGGRDYTVPPLHASDWLSVLLEEDLDLSGIIPGLLGEDDQAELSDAVWRDEVTEEEIEEVCLDLIKETAGRDWWWVLHLLWSAASAWMVVYGRLVMQGVKPDELPLAAFLDALYLTCVQNMDKQQRSEFDRMLERPPAHIAPEDAINEDAESAAFLKMMNQSG